MVMFTTPEDVVVFVNPSLVRRLIKLQGGKVRIVFDTDDHVDVKGEVADVASRLQMIY